MKILIILLIVLSTSLFSNSLDNLLEEYKNTSEESLQTINEKLGHVTLYSKKDIKMMQYNTLNDILKELPLVELNRDKYGLQSPTTSGTKVNFSGLFRFFIDDYEVSSGYDKSSSLSWGDVPLDFIDHIEIYYGDSSFSLGNDTGLYFIRMYTKSAEKENATELKSIISNNTNSQSVTQSKIFKNDWSYLVFLNNTAQKRSSEYNNNTLENNTNQKFFYLNVSNNTTNINVGYTGVKKDTYMGNSTDIIPDEGEIESEDFFINVNKYFLNDKSIKASFSANYNYNKIEEENSEGLLIFPVVDFNNIVETIPTQLNENVKFTQVNALLSKELNYNNHNILAAINIKHQEYDVKNRKTLNLFNEETDHSISPNEFSDFSEETVYSLLFQDDYKVNEKLFFVGNIKFDQYQRDKNTENFNEKLFRAGIIYTPYKNFGIKSFYTQTYLPPTFYNVDFESQYSTELKSQEYDIFTMEGVYTTEKSKLSTIYYDIKTEGIMYLSPTGFINVPNTIKTRGISFNYEYFFSNKEKLQFFYYTAWQDYDTKDTNDGALIKYFGSYDKFDYFTSLIYRDSFAYENVSIKKSFNFSLGTTYNYSDTLSFSLKGENLFDKSTGSIYYDYFQETYLSLADEDTEITFSMKWVF